MIKGEPNTNSLGDYFNSNTYSSTCCTNSQSIRKSYLMIKLSHDSTVFENKASELLPED